MIPSSVCQKWPSDRSGPAGNRGDCSVSYTTRWDTIAEAKNKFGEMVDMARSAPVASIKYDRPVLVVTAVEEFERMQALDGGNEGDLANDVRRGGPNERY